MHQHPFSEEVNNVANEYRSTTLEGVLMYYSICLYLLHTVHNIVLHFLPLPHEGSNVSFTLCTKNRQLGFVPQNASSVQPLTLRAMSR